MEENLYQRKNYKGRVLRPDGWMIIQDVVIKKLGNEPVLLFLDWFYNNMKEEINNPQLKACFPCSMYWVDCAMLYLLWLCKYPPQSKFEKVYHVPHSSAGEAIMFMRKKVSE